MCPLLWLYLFRLPLINSSARTRLFWGRRPLVRSLNASPHRSPAPMQAPHIPFQFYHAALL